MGIRYSIEMESGNVIEAGIRGRIRLSGSRLTNPVAAGDTVEIETSAEGEYMISKILPRQNYIIRKSVKLSKESHILAANINRAYLIVTLIAPETLLSFVDRFLVAAESFRIPVSLLFNKMDFYLEEQLPIVEDTISLYQNIGYSCEKISALNRDNIDFLKADIKGKQVMIAGHSGTGKSTLINALDDTLNIKTSVISTSHLQGQHTTTFAEMHKLKSGGYIIDTPGIRAFGIIDLEKEHLSHYFPEMRKLLNQCRFNNCMHLKEPGCKVKESVESGKIALSRYETYADLMMEDRTETYR